MTDMLSLCGIGESGAVHSASLSAMLILPKNFFPEKQIFVTFLTKNVIAEVKCILLCLKSIGVIVFYYMKYIEET